MKTKTIIEYGAIDLTANEDSTLSTSNIQDFSTANDIKQRPQEIKYATLEHNYFILDGSLTNMPSDVGNVGYWSKTKTGSNKEFTTPITLTINFTKNHSSVGLTLRFSQYSYCTHLKITYYDSSNNKISEKEFYPDTFEYFCEDGVSNYRKIIITFYSTNEADRYIKLYSITYGTGMYFEGDDLINASIVEEVDPLSNELSINTLDFTVFATDNRFDILNPKGIYAMLQQRQKLRAIKEVNNVQTEMGSFYLESWENVSSKSMKFKGIDLIGMLDKVEFNGGIYDNVSATTLIQSIFTAANITNYTIQDITSDTITGYLPICTCREALQQVLFTIGAVADCSRSEKINIYKLSTSIEAPLINNDVILKDTKQITQGEIVTGITVTTHTYKLKRATETIYEENLAAGTYKIVFNTPATNLSITGGTITESGVNYAIITATGSSSESSKYYGNKTVTITGNTYDDLTNNITVTDGELHDKTNILTVEDCTLINGNNGETIATRILNHYLSQYTDTFDVILSSEKAGDNVATERSRYTQLNGHITKLDIDLTGGYIAKAELIAKVGDAPVIKLLAENGNYLITEHNDYLEV